MRAALVLALLLALLHAFVLAFFFVPERSAPRQPAW